MSTINESNNNKFSVIPDMLSAGNRVVKTSSLKTGFTNGVPIIKWINPIWDEIICNLRRSMEFVTEHANNNTPWGNPARLHNLIFLMKDYLKSQLFPLYIPVERLRHMEDSVDLGNTHISYRVVTKESNGHVIGVNDGEDVVVLGVSTAGGGSGRGGDIWAGLYDGGGAGGNSLGYIVKPEDLIGDIKDFPIEVVQAMVNEQVSQGNKADVTIFQNYNRSDRSNGGFDWNEKWLRIIMDKEFHLLFKEMINKQQELVPEVKGVMMEVSQDGIKWFKDLVLCKYKNLYYTELFTYIHARPIQEPVKEDYLFKLTPEQGEKIKTMLDRGEI